MGDFMDDPPNVEERMDKTESRVGRLEVQVAQLKTDMEWVKKLATTNVVISVSSLISIIISILLLASRFH